MNEVTLVFPHQLFPDSPALSKKRKVVLVEDELFFDQYKFHKQKMVLHRASMKFYENDLRERGFAVDYVESRMGILKDVVSRLAEQEIRVIHLTDPHDYLLDRRLKRFAALYSIRTQFYDTPGFLCGNDYLEDYFRQRKRYFLNEFYIDQRKRLNILLSNGEPTGGKWNYDVENRKKMPSTVRPPAVKRIPARQQVIEAQRYVELKFGAYYGEMLDFNYPICRHDALAWTETFFEERFQNYGIYQDAVVVSDSKLFHSLLTPALNIGLITPDEILDRAISVAVKNNVPLNSLEGFCRQILGWREFVRALYRLEGVRQRTSNHFAHRTKIPDSFWTGTTGIEPVDNVIHKVLNTAYCNHIERLMIIGNFMLLCEFDPDLVYRWFMELFIDSYDWVMVPNVYGMSQYADGGLMSTKPYISGSNYVLKMSNFKKGPWCEVWDSLYWCFIDKHRKEFVRNPRMSMMVKQLEKIDTARMKRMRQSRDRFLSGV